MIDRKKRDNLSLALQDTMLESIAEDVQLLMDKIHEMPTELDDSIKLKIDELKEATEHFNNYLIEAREENKELLKQDGQEAYNETSKEILKFLATSTASFDSIMDEKFDTFEQKFNRLLDNFEQETKGNNAYFESNTSNSINNFNKTIDAKFNKLDKSINILQNIKPPKANYAVLFIVLILSLGVGMVGGTLFADQYYKELQTKVDNHKLYLSSIDKTVSTALTEKQGKKFFAELDKNYRAALRGQ